MKLQNARNAYYDHRGQVSESVRILALAEIGAVWVLRIGDSSTAITDKHLLPLVLFVACLAAHLIQYIAATASWGIYHRIKERQPHVDDRTEFLAPQWLNWPGNTFFVLKVLLVVVGYMA